MVSINRYNYEEYFLLYVDNELNAAERKHVETFVAENPDLEGELMMLKQLQLKPDASLVWEDKSSLFKSEKQTLINLENYETFFLLYVDEELSAEDRRAVELFASQHPAQQQELEILMQTRITPESSVVFPDKASLYKKVGSEKVVALREWRIVAVAAMLILTVGILWMNSETDTTQPDFATNKDQGSKKNNDGQVAQNSNGSSNDAGNKEQVSEIKNPESGITKGENNITKDKRNLNAPKQDESGHVAVNTPPTSVNTDPEFPERSVIPRMIAKVDVVQPEVTGRENLITNTLIIDQPYEQSKPKESIALTRAETEPDDMLAIGPVQTKNKFRGLFRRVTRVVEKNTHITTGENKRLLIGNLEIALK